MPAAGGHDGGDRGHRHAPGGWLATATAGRLAAGFRAAAGAGHELLRSNLDQRAAVFTSPGPVSTGVPVTWFAYERMVVEIDVWAMA